MPSRQPESPFCQSCGMPLEKPEHLGTAADGFQIDEYCRFCFQNGVFTAPDISMEGMIDRCAAIMAGQGILPESRARALMSEVIPTLKRWQTK